MIKGGKQPREVVGLVVGGRSGADQADAAGGGGDCGQERDGLEAEALGITDIVGERRAVGEEDGIELIVLGGGRELLIIGDVENAARRRALVAPRRFVVSAGIDEQVEGKLALVLMEFSPR